MELLQEERTLWRRPVLLAVGLLAAEQSLSELTALRLETLLAKLAAGDAGAAGQGAGWSAEVLDIVGHRPLSRLKTQLAQIERNRDRRLSRMARQPVHIRVESARVLGYLGDPRFRDDAWGMQADNTLGFVRIPAGPFQLRGYEIHIEDEPSIIFPPEWVTLPELWMASYPVTVGQWRAFVRATGSRPQDATSLHSIDNEPARYISRNEAEVYTRWLNSTLRAWTGCPAAVRALLDAGWGVRLPSAAEWERAACGTEFLHWPWGNIGIPVGCIPPGSRLCRESVLDEWVGGDDEYPVRWAYWNPPSSRCGRREKDPSRGYHTVGFRFCLSVNSEKAPPAILSATAKLTE